MGEEDVDVTAGGEHKRYSGRVSARRGRRGRRRSCFVAKREVEETNLGMWMTKKREEDNTSVIFIVGVKIRCMGRPSGNWTGHRQCISIRFVKPRFSRERSGGGI